MPQSAAFSGWGMAPGLSAIQPITAETTLFRQDACQRSAAFIEGGWVKIVRLEQDGQDRAIALYPPGSLLGAKEGVLRRFKGRLIFPDPKNLCRAPEIESVVESNQRQSGQFTLADPIYA